MGVFCSWICFLDYSLLKVRFCVKISEMSKWFKFISSSILLWIANSCFWFQRSYFWTHRCTVSAWRTCRANSAVAHEKRVVKFCSVKIAFNVWLCLQCNLHWYKWISKWKRQGKNIKTQLFQRGRGDNFNKISYSTYLIIIVCCQKNQENGRCHSNKGYISLYLLRNNCF